MFIHASIIFHPSIHYVTTMTPMEELKKKHVFILYLALQEFLSWNWQIHRTGTPHSPFMPEFTAQFTITGSFNQQLNTTEH
jgi:hypothetical protein